MVLILGFRNLCQPSPVRLLNRTTGSIPRLLSNSRLSQKIRLYNRLLLQSHTLVRPGRIRRTLRTELDRYRNRHNLRHHLRTPLTHQRHNRPKQILSRSIDRTEVARLEEDRGNSKRLITVRIHILARLLELNGA